MMKCSLNLIFTKKHTGFSKIELLVVIAVLTILVLLAVPQLLGYTRQAETTRLLNNGGIIESAVAQYKIINEEWPTAGVAAITPSVMALDGTMIHRDNPEIANKTFYAVDRIRIDRSISRIDDTTRFVVDEGGSVYILNLEHIGVTGVQVDTPSLVLLVGESADANASIVPANASVGGVIWETSDATIASVDNNGIITAHAAGQAIVTAYSLNYLSHSDTITVAVLSAPTAIITMTPSTNINTTTSVTFTHNTESNGVAITAAEWQLNTGAITTTAPSGRFTAGTHTVRLRVLDANATWSEWVSVDFNVFAIPIAFIGMTPQTNITTTTNVVFNHTTSIPSEGTIVGAEWQRNSDAITTTPPSGIFSAGTHTVRLRVQNSAGVWSEWVTKIFSVTATQPIAFITMTPQTNITTTTNVVFSHTASTPSEGTIVGAEWQRNSDTITTTSPSGTFPVGTHVIRLRVRNSVGTWSEWVMQSFSVVGLEFTGIFSRGPHSLALRNDGTVWTWGNNGLGQLGDGTIINRSIPVRTLNLTNITAVASGSVHSLALRNDGTVWAWGNNANGRLGDGTSTNSPTPIRVSGLTNITAISGGNNHSLALRSDGTIWAWGQNIWGQLGDATTINRSTPVQVSGLTNIIAISGGGFHSLALRNDGTVWVWGLNSSGQLGDGTATNRSTPVQTLNPTNITAIAGGNTHSLALRSDGTVWAWGSNGHGQLGDNGSANRLTPAQVLNLTNATAITIGDGHSSLALRNDNTVWVWGDNDFGQLGDGTLTDRRIPIPVLSPTNIMVIAGGDRHSLALRNDGTIWAWGRNNFGQLGDGTVINRSIPVRTLLP